MEVAWSSDTLVHMYQFTLLHIPEDGNLQGRVTLPLPVQIHQSASDNETMKLGTISISNSSRVSEVHGDHTLAPSGHATKLTWLQSVHYTCFMWPATRNTAHHTHFSSVGICASGQLVIHAVTMIHPVSPFVLLCNNIMAGGFVSVRNTLNYCNCRSPPCNFKTLLQ